MRPSVFFRICGAVVICVWILGCGARPLSKSTQTDFDVIIIGAGMGGLSAATHLAANGMRVLVLEQNHQVGGCTSSFSRGVFNFDIALHEMSLGGDGLIERLLEASGVREKVELIQIPELGRVIFPGLDFVYPNGVDAIQSALCEQWPTEKENIYRFFELLAEIEREVFELRELYLTNPVRALLMKTAIPFRQPTLAAYRNATLQEVLDEFFVDEKLKAVIGQFWVYHGPPPSQQWALIYLIATYSYMKNGAWHIKGSSQALAQAYQQRIIELGGEVRTNTLVTGITVANNKVQGVVTASGEAHTSRYVVSNADPYQTFFKLIDKDHSPEEIRRKISAMQPSNSLVGVYLGLDVPLTHWGIEEYEVFYNTGYDSDAMYTNAMAGRFDQGFASFTFYSNLNDDFYAPEGKAAIVINSYSEMLTWPPEGEAYEKQKAAMMDTLIGMAEHLLPGLREHIVVKEGMTPRTIERYTLNRGGVPYGWNFTPEQQDRLPIPTSIGGLYLAGAWTWPGHSVSLAQVSGYIAAQLILKQEE
ncbi:MAG: NAD(P)/FAD-dependent oxidoreductase [Myxococcota bacterium]|nr:NAD(P)/FAD-dependent oxidoreductase [Myxococcota bacterium]